MDVSHILNPLNAAQREAVGASPGPLLILAGAGSGKTRVLTHRIAWLVQAAGVSPISMLAVTFTNKAAREMTARVEKLLRAQDFGLGGMWIGTFHALCHRLLRIHYADANLPQGFEILDSDDQYRMVRRVLRELELDEKHWPPKQAQWMINHHKESARRAADLPSAPDSDPAQQTLTKIYQHYEQLCQRLGLVDFAELLLRALELLRRNQSIRENYQQRFAHVLVDEFQDTNAIQYQWLRILSEPQQNLFAVGDDDQSIYGWRGARVENLLRFEKHFPGAQLFRLEQNYRSSGTILRAANAVIAENSGRLGKKLWTEGADGAPIQIYAADNEIDEARFVVGRAGEWVARGQRRDSIAILYRTGAQSRVLEEELLAAGMPYRVYGGFRFFERAEIKDALAYLRLVSNRDSDQALERIINVPPRGIGDKTISEVRVHARREGISMWCACAELIRDGGLPGRGLAALQQFRQRIDEMAGAIADLELGEAVDHVLIHSGLLKHFREQRGERAQSRAENLEELVNAARNFSTHNLTRDTTTGTEAEAGDDAEAAMSPLTRFLAHAALEAGEGQAEEWEDCVQLMTLHSAKGLEFPLVFLCGLEEGIFPHARALGEDGDKHLEEERRLCYVGMTRAMQELVICHADLRRLYGREQYMRRSRFVQEIPAEYTQSLRVSGLASIGGGGIGTGTGAGTGGERAVSTVANAGNGRSDFTLGQLVRHAKFGEGTVLNLEGHGEHARVEVNFANPEMGRKWLVCAYANLQAV